MKSRRPTETDLANMAFEPYAVKLMRLENLIKPKPIHGSYEPFRSTAGDAVNQQFPFLDEDRVATPLGILEKIIERACKGDPTLLKMNLEVARSTHDFATTRNMTAERVEVRAITLAFGHNYHFGLPLIMRNDGRASAIFPDLRRTNRLSPKGCRFVFSAMHQRWRVNYPDLAALCLSIWQYANNDSRTIREVFCSDNELIPYELLVADVRDTYAILHSIIMEGEYRRRRSGGGAGPLFGT